MASAIPWPQDLVRQVANKNVVIFVGAGASMGSSNSDGARPLSWNQLLAELGALVCTPYQIRAKLKPLISKGQYLLAAEYIRSVATAGGDLNHYRDSLVRLCDGPENDRFQPTDLHNRILDLSPSMIVTTNFDQLLERAAGDGYDVMIYNEPEIDNAVRQGKNVILKLHGSVKHGVQMILTQSDFVSLRRDGALALEVLQSLLLTRMALFIGYSFNDPDLQQILEALYGIPGRKPGHVLVTNGALPGFQKDIFTEAYGLSVVHYPEGRHELLQQGIEELVAALA